MTSADRALDAVRRRAQADRATATERIRRAVDDPTAAEDLVAAAPRLRSAGRLTLNFHPDRIAASGLTVAGGLLADGRYRSQWSTWLSNGGRSAIVGGERHAWERELFDGAYEHADPAFDEPCLYGALDLLTDPHGGSPSFGSSFLVLAAHVFDRATLCVGDSHLGPSDVGTGDDVEPILAGLAEQAAGGELLGRRLGLADLRRALDGELLANGPGRVFHHYVEAQIHGGVSLDGDVAAIVVDPSFRGTAVERDLTAAARAYRLDLAWHPGSRLDVAQVPDDFRGPTMPALAREVAAPDTVLTARHVGEAAAAIAPSPPRPTGDPEDSPRQQLKYLWHTVLAFGVDAEPMPS